MLFLAANLDLIRLNYGHLPYFENVFSSLPDALVKLQSKSKSGSIIISGILSASCVRITILSSLPALWCIVSQEWVGLQAWLTIMIVIVVNGGGPDMFEIFNNLFCRLFYLFPCVHVFLVWCCHMDLVLWVVVHWVLVCWNFVSYFLAAGYCCFICPTTCHIPEWVATTAD